MTEAALVGVAASQAGWSAGSEVRTTTTSLALVAGDLTHGGGPSAGRGHALDSPNFDVVDDLAFGADDLDTHGADTWSAGKWRA
jgi:hypothetical protein